MAAFAAYTVFAAHAARTLDRGVFPDVCESFGLFALETSVGFLGSLRRSRSLGALFGSLFLSLPTLWLPDCVKNHQQQDDNDNEFHS
jgi:hypothetical protein